MDRAFSKWLAISMGLIVFLLIGNAWLSCHNICRLNENAARVAHTHEVMDALEELVSTMKDAQTGERGYIITGEIRYLEPYNSATAAIDGNLQRLKQLTADNPRQQARIPPLQQRIQEELDVLKRNIAVAKKDLEAARQAVMTGAGKKALDAIRLQVVEMEQEEQDLLRERKQQASSSYQVAVATCFLAALLGLGMVGAIIFLLRRYLLARMQVAAVLHEQAVLVLRDDTKQKRVQEESRLNEARLQALVQLNQMAGASLQMITDFVLESAVALTNSRIGYLAFLNDDETVMTMHSWSKTAMQECAIIDKPIVYPVVTTGLWGEAVRQRKPVITNDYQAPNPLKKGHPEGHVKMLRHMNAPIFDEERIVVVAGVGNKDASYDESDVRQLTLLMQGMWQLICRKRQEEEIRRAHDDLEIRVQERTAELAQTNVALSHAKDAAETSSRAKSTFLANMSHEIRTPLNAVIGMTELVLKGQLSAQQREFLQTVKDSGEALLSVINDILDFSKIEAGKLVLDRRGFDLRENLGDTMKSFAIRAHQQGLELACFIHTEVPHMVVGDYNRLRQIVVNLVANAIKFTESGEVTLEVTPELRSDKDIALHFTVADTGIGIPPDKQAAIFEMFEQADASTTRRHSGTGLGLAIASRLVNLMDGRIWVESEVGRGSRFHFIVRLDVGETEPREVIHPEPVCLHGLRVLVVDDNATNRRILDEVLRSWQMVPATAPSAAEAIKLLLEARQKGESYRLVLTDAHMPHMDGFMLAEQIQRDLAMDSTVVMMLTSGDRQDDPMRCKELGITSYLLKPVKHSELLEAIEYAMGVTAIGQALPLSGVQRALSGLRILLVEDSLVNQKLAVALLEGQGHQVTVAKNGRQALAVVETQQFDLAVMDIQMPEMDGLEATAAIRVGERGTERHLPIIAMTAHALQGDRERCLEAGMDKYITKPICAKELFDTIESLVTAPALPQTQPASAEAWEEGVNWLEALQNMQGNNSLLKTVVKAALEEIPRLTAAICQAVASSDATALRLSAHTLKGSLRYFGQSRVCEELLRLEKMGQDRDLSGAAEVYQILEPAMQRTTQCLQDYLQQRGTPDA